MSRIAVIGSRGFRNLLAVDKYVAGRSRKDVIITGGARGVDKAAENAAERRRISRCIHEPACDDDDPFYVAELHERNNRIIKDCDELVAFWDGHSPGTKSVVNKARRAGKRVTVILDTEPT